MIAKKLNVPRIRFPEFKGKWNKLKLGSIAVQVGEKNTNAEGFEVCSISNQYGFVSQSEQFKTRRLEGLDKSQYKIVSRGDFAYNPARINVGSIALLDNWAKALVSSLYVCFRFKKGYSELFFKQYITTKKFKTSVLRNTEGSVREYLFFENFSRITCYFPSYPEQQKIASLFSVIDQRIEKQQEKISCLEEYKKGLMQKIFSQEIRFKDANGKDYPEWEEEELGNIVDIIGGGTPSTENDKYWNGVINWYTPTEIKDGIKYIYESKRKISKEGLQNSGASMLPPGTVLLTTRASVGDMAITKTPSTTNQGFQSLVVKKEVSNEFIFYCQPIIKKHCVKHASGSTFKEISKKNIASLRINIPSLPEQQKILQVLSKLDELIDKNKELLEQWKLLKKGLLQQMFI